MNSPTPIRWLRLNVALLTLILPLFMVGFQNCSPKNFDVGNAEDPNKTTSSCTGSSCVNTCPDTNPDCNGSNPNPTPTPTTPSTGTFDLIDQIVQTDPGTPKEWTAQYSGDRKNYQLSFASGSVVASLVIPDVGTVEVLNQTSWLLRFTPLASFTGSKDVSLYAIEGTSRLIDGARLTLAAGVNTVIPILQPALAVRGSACAMCHADVRSNIITDFGFGGDGKGRDYYFGRKLSNSDEYDWNDGASYGDDKAFLTPDYAGPLGNWAQLNLTAGKKVIIPQGTTVTGSAKSLSGASTLKQYLQSRFSLSPYSNTVNANVAEYSNVFIGAPSKEKLRTVFGLSASDATLGITYVRNAGGAALSGLAVSGSYVKNTGTVTCEGDVLVNGVLYLSNLSLTSKTGCRIYSTGSVFVYGGINYTSVSGEYETTNLQLVSSKAILMGLGSLNNGSGVHCEKDLTPPAVFDSSSYFYWDNASPAGRAAYIASNPGISAAEIANYDKATWDSMYNRMTFWMNGSQYYRNDSRSGFAIGLDILGDYTKIGAQKDASCAAEKRNVSFTRLLLNAPQVHSRYMGDFSGVIITEFLLPSLGQFHFRYDPVFLKAPILPKLEATDYLKVN